MIKSDRWIMNRAARFGMIEPFVSRLINRDDFGNRMISYGLSSYGYDCRCDREFKIFSNVITNKVIDPLQFDDAICTTQIGNVCIVPPNSLVLCNSIEYFKIPENVHAYVLGKSTYARSGLHCLTTPLEAGWEGQITIEMANVTQMPIKLYAGHGVAQVCFHEAEEACMTSYGERNGKYQGQRGVTFSRG